MSTNATAETLSFQTEVKQLLKLMIHSLYSNREIFLRELISNASDACDKRRFVALNQPELAKDAPAPEIHIEFDENAHTISIRDTGIGMTRAEIIDHLGTIAKSGTADFLAKLSGDQKSDSLLIGQFGVGFYSAFIVADQVVVESRRLGQPADSGVCWRSDGGGEFTVEPVELTQVGTKVTLHLKEAAHEFANAWRLRALIKRYSDHISFPVRLWTSDEVKKNATPDPVNSAKALWTRNKAEISEAEYQEFYQHIAHDGQAPLAWTHNRVEGKREYTSLVYIPATAPFDLYARDAARGLKLYVKRVFILDDAEQFLPLYLRFVKGVVDSSDLPLNVSRELLQEDPEIEAIRSGITKRVLDVLQKMASDEPDKYLTFWQSFGSVLKEGIGEDSQNREKIAKLLRFASTHQATDKQDQSLDQVIARLKVGQDKIYYAIGETHHAVRHSPHLERLTALGIEVLLLSDRIDEWMMSYLGEYEGKSFQDVARGELDLAQFEDKQTQSQDKASEDDPKTLALCGRLKEVLGGHVSSVKTSTRLRESPACLVRDAQDMGVSMRKLMEAAGQSLPASKPTLEINASHPLIARLAATKADAEFKELASVLFDQASLAEGGTLADPAGFVRKMNNLLFAAAPVGG
jgi:molecular chaperone HtpG